MLFKNGGKKDQDIHFMYMLFIDFIFWYDIITLYFLNKFQRGYT